MKLDLDMKSYTVQQKHLLTERMKSIRLERCKKVFNFLKSNSATVKIFSDKKIFTADAYRNRRNDRFIASSSDEVLSIQKTKHPQGVMVLGVVCSDGKVMPPVVFPPRTKGKPQRVLHGLTVHNFTVA